MFTAAASTEFNFDVSAIRLVVFTESDDIVSVTYKDVDVVK